MHVLRSSCLAALFALGACDSKVTSTIDPRVDMLEDCFPNLYAKVQALLDIAETWRLNTSGNVPDPAGLAWSQQGDGSLLATLPVDSSTVTMVIRFYSPTGTEQNIDVSSANTLGEALDIVATELRNLFPNDDKFMVGEWSISGGGVDASGEGLTAIIGGSTNQNELEELRTTEVTPAGGPPPVAPSTITDTGTGCALTFTITSLVTDDSPTQEYPRGTVDLQVVGPATSVDATLTFDETAIATIVVDGLPGSFAFNIETRTLTYVP